MTETTNLTTKNQGVPIASSVEKQLVKITGTLTSPIQLRGENTKEIYHYSFIRLKGQSIDLPVIFKEKPTNLKKSDEVELTGHYSNSNKNVRKSFTAYSYQLLSEKRIRKKCIGCCDNFTCSNQKDYDYCRGCEINGSRYINKKSPCPECDDSGLIKFPNQPARNCKTCYLTNQTIKGENVLPK